MHLRLLLNTTAPVFSFGADQSDPEVRAPEIRGALRYWLRALLGAYMHASEVSKIESSLLGSDQIGSPLIVRLGAANGDFEDVPSTNIKTNKYQMLPHKNQALANALDDNSWLALEMVNRLGGAIDDRILAALGLLLLFGGIGRRSRRMFGGLQLDDYTFLDGSKASKSISLDNIVLRDIDRKTANLPMALQKVINNLIEQSTTLMRSVYQKQELPFGEVPQYPIFHSKHCQIYIGKESFYNMPSKKSAATAANESFFRSIAEFKHEDMIGYAKGNDRRASPIHAQVRFLGDKAYPILTIFRSEIPKFTDWGRYNELIANLNNEWKLIHVWGEKWK